MSDLGERARSATLISSGHSFGARKLFGELADEIERLQDAKRIALQLADERAMEANELRQQLENAKGYVTRAIASYEGDPADNQFQRGFLAALEVVRDEAFSVTDETGK